MGSSDSSLEDVVVRTQNALARELKPFGIRPRRMRIDGESVHGYDRKAFEEASARYLTDDRP